MAFLSPPLMTGGGCRGGVCTRFLCTIFALFDPLFDPKMRILTLKTRLFAEKRVILEVVWQNFRAKRGQKWSKMVQNFTKIFVHKKVHAAVLIGNAHFYN
jgi:hypothetical protein